jgi:hypothetical protein
MKIIYLFGVIREMKLKKKHKVAHGDYQKCILFSVQFKLYTQTKVFFNLFSILSNWIINFFECFFGVVELRAIQNTEKLRVLSIKE